MFSCLHIFLNYTFRVSVLWVEFLAHSSYKHRSQNKLDVHCLENIISISNLNVPMIFVRHFTFKLLLTYFLVIILTENTQTKLLLPILLLLLLQFDRGLSLLSILLFMRWNRSCKRKFRISHQNFLSFYSSAPVKLVGTCYAFHEVR